jgi:hypothetical protein
MRGLVWCWEFDISFFDWRFLHSKSQLATMGKRCHDFFLHYAAVQSGRKAYLVIISFFFTVVHLALPVFHKGLGRTWRDVNCKVLHCSVLLTCERTSGKMHNVLPACISIPPIHQHSALLVLPSFLLLDLILITRRHLFDRTLRLIINRPPRRISPKSAAASSLSSPLSVKASSSNIGRRGGRDGSKSSILYKPSVYSSEDARGGLPRRLFRYYRYQ